jgi:putative membrane protein
VIRSLALSGVMALSLMTGSLMAGAPALAQPAAPVPSTNAFITAAAQSDEYERQAGRMAQMSALDANVRAFGAMMVTDHTKSTQELKAAIQKAGLTAPSAKPLSTHQQQWIDSLRLSVGMPTFDATYIDQQVTAHKQALALMQSYAKSGENATLRATAASIAPVVQQHLTKAQQIKKNLP